MQLAQLSKFKYDYIIIGAGSGGLVVARGLAKTGKECLLISKTLGGDCTNHGCIPSKTFLELAEIYRKSGDTNILLNVFKLVQDKVSEFHALDLEAISDFDYFECKARFISPKSLELKDFSGNTKVVTFRKKCIIATGSKPKMVEIEGVGYERILNNESILTLPKLPKSISIIGSGPVALEYATGLAKFGVYVNLFVRNKFLSTEPRETANILKASLIALGVQIFEETSIKYVEKNLIHIISRSGSEVSIPETEFYFEAIGRIPNISLNLESANIKYDQQGILVNQNLITSNPSIFAIGDCIGSGNFTHLANYHGRWVVEKILFPYMIKSTPTVPKVIFSDPTFSSVGATNINDQFTKKFVLNFSSTDDAILKGNTNCFGIVNVNMLNGVVKGVSLVGNGSEDMINIFTLICDRKMSLFRLRSFISPYPTKMNSFNQLVSAFLISFKLEWKNYYKRFIFKYKYKFIALILWLILIISFFTYLAFTGNTWQNFVLSTLVNYLKSPTGMIAFVIIYILRAFVGLSATLLTIVGAYLFGFIPGLLLSIVSSNISSSVNYFTGKFFGREGLGSGQFIKNIFSSNDFYSVLYARIAFFPYDLLSFLSGFQKINYLDFLKATFIGGLPGTFAIALIGSSLSSKDLAMGNIVVRFEYLLLGTLLLAILVFVAKYFIGLKKR